MSFWHEAEAHPSKVALVCPDQSTITFSDLAGHVNRLSRALRNMGITEGDHVAFLLGNQPEYYEVVLACFQIGVFYTALNPLLVETEISYILADSSARVFIADEGYGEVAQRAADLASVPSDGRLCYGTIDEFRSVRELASRESIQLPAHRSMGAAFSYTSGTTGFPKAVERSVGGPIAQGMGRVETGARESGFAPDDVHLVQGFLSGSGPGDWSLFSLHLGSTLVLMSKWNAVRVLELIERYRVTTSFMVPTMLRRLMELPEHTRRSSDVSSLKAIIMSGSPCSVDLKRAVIGWWGPVIWERYGGTEMSCSMVSSLDWLKHPGTVGRPFATVRILDDHLRECQTAATGTIYFRVEGAPLPRYFNAPAKTSGSIHDGYFTLGDMGYLDAEGWLYIVDRKVDMIISGGINIYPAEIEAVLMAHPAVADAAVIGIANPDMGEEVVALVELHAHEVASAALSDNIIAFVRQRVARYKTPRRVEFRRSLGRLPSGKLFKRRLRDEFLAESQ